MKTTKNNWPFLATILENKYLLSMTKRQENMFDNKKEKEKKKKKPFSILKNRNMVFFIKHLLVVFNYFHIFFMIVLKNNYTNIKNDI